jgi:hypothetical protein
MKVIDKIRESNRLDELATNEEAVLNSVCSVRSVMKSSSVADPSSNISGAKRRSAITAGVTARSAAYAQPGSPTR